MGRSLKAQCPGAPLCSPTPLARGWLILIDSAHPDHDAAYQVEGIGGSAMPAACDPSVIDAADRVTDEESFMMTRRLLLEEGLLVGGSSGTALVAGAASPPAGATVPWWLFSPILGTAIFLDPGR